MEEAEAAILAIVDPPKAEIGKTYMGRVVNITKFGAFVNILPGRDGLVHISKLGRGKRINAVEDVLSLGDEIEVVVEEIDDRGKVSLPRAAAVTATAAARRSAPATSRPCRSRLPSTPSSRASSATSARPASVPVTTTTVARSGGDRGDRPWRRPRWRVGTAGRRHRCPSREPAVRERPVGRSLTGSFR
jgi:predicted RNA-binding protein with RPS1 domain